LRWRCLAGGHHVYRGGDDADYTRMGRWAALAFSVILAGGAWAVASGSYRTVVDLSFMLLSLAPRGISGAILFGLLTRRGDACAVPCVA
jgi:hypothetical protein